MWDMALGKAAASLAVHTDKVRESETAAGQRLVKGAPEVYLEHFVVYTVLS